MSLGITYVIITCLQRVNTYVIPHYCCCYPRGTAAHLKCHQRPPDARKRAKIEQRYPSTHKGNKRPESSHNASGEGITYVIDHIPGITIVIFRICHDYPLCWPMPPATVPGVTYPAYLEATP